MPHYTSPLAESIAPDLLARFDRYVRVDTQSGRGEPGQTPTTPGQLDLARLLAEELLAIGLPDAAVDGNGYVTATLPATAGAADVVVGLIAHVDTSPDAPGDGVVPIVHRAYDGGVITLPKAGTRLDPARERELGAKTGHDIVTSSGDTLLGADDKAGVAEIMAAVAHLQAHPELPRPTLRICFTPDEEVGHGASLLDIEAFGARAAYTLDGSSLGEIQDETFSALAATLVVTGVDVHPGWAKDVLVNAAATAARIVAALPPELTPERTDGRDGFIHVYAITGDATRTTIQAIVRDFDDDLLAGHAELLRTTAQRVVDMTPGASLVAEIVPQYPNMGVHLAPYPEIVDHAIAAIRAEGIEPIREPIRGGTDGSLLSARGLPTPNLFTGGHAYHSVREWASLQDMAAAAAVVVRLAGEWARA